MSFQKPCITGLDNLPPSVCGCVLTIGNFDGVHLGHQSILARAKVLSAQSNAPLVVMTFEPHPDLVLRPKDAPKRLTHLDTRCCLLHDAGADIIVVAQATGELLSLEARAFIDRILVRSFSPSHIVEGKNFRFGKGRAGNIQTLRGAAGVLGFGVHDVDPLMMDVEGHGTVRVSSTLIRNLVAAGDVKSARQCLGRPYALVGPVVAGAGRGRILEFPTANLSPGEQVMPADGVYAARAEIDGHSFMSAVSIGTKPTFGPSDRTIEAFLIDASGDFYNQEMTLHFMDRLREQRKFANAEELKHQIAQDVQRVREHND